jgi:ceramide glucosyltransferase
MQNFVPGVGLVVGVPVAERPEGLAGHIEAFLLNGHARLLLTASALGLGFGVGKSMLFKRSDLARAGGFESIAYTLAEDTALSRGFAALGLKTVFAHRPLRQFIGKRSLREIYQRQLRWAVIRRAHEVFTFPLEPLSSPLPAAIAAGFAARLVGLPALTAFASTLGVWFAAEILIAWIKGWEISFVSPAGFIGREILALATWLQAWTTNDVVWANGRFDVFSGARGAAPEGALSLKGQSAGADKG